MKKFLRLFSFPVIVIIFSIFFILFIEKFNYTPKYVFTYYDTIHGGEIGMGTSGMIISGNWTNPWYGATNGDSSIDDI